MRKIREEVDEKVKVLSSTKKQAAAIKEECRECKQARQDKQNE